MTLQKKNNISPQKPKFEIIENVMVISIKNHLKDGVDLDCFNILILIYRTLGLCRVSRHFILNLALK